MCGRRQPPWLVTVKVKLRSRLVPALARKLEDAGKAIRAKLIHRGDQGRCLGYELLHVGRAEDQVTVRLDPRKHGRAAALERPAQHVIFVCDSREPGQSAAPRARALFRYPHENYVHAHRRAISWSRPAAGVLPLRARRRPCRRRGRSAVPRRPRRSTGTAAPPGHSYLKGINGDLIGPSTGDIGATGQFGVTRPFQCPVRANGAQKNG